MKLERPEIIQSMLLGFLQAAVAGSLASLIIFLTLSAWLNGEISRIGKSYRQHAEQTTQNYSRLILEQYPKIIKRTIWLSEGIADIGLKLDKLDNLISDIEEKLK